MVNEASQCVKPILQDTEGLAGEDVQRLVKTRVNQDVFRRMILANYNCKCSLTGISNVNLLLASRSIQFRKTQILQTPGFLSGTWIPSSSDKGL